MSVEGLTWGNTDNWVTEKVKPVKNTLWDYFIDDIYVVKHGEDGRLPQIVTHVKEN